METFSSVSNFNYENLENLDNSENLSNDDNILVYQVQAFKNENKVLIKEVGKLKIVSNILINKFELKPNFMCYIVSCIYDLNLLKEIEKFNKYDMIKIIINNSEKKIGEISLVFEAKNNIISDPINLNNNMIEGAFQIEFRINGQFFILEKINEYLGNDEMITKLMENLISENVFDMLL